MIGNKIGTTYISIVSEQVGLFPIKAGYVVFVIRPYETDMSWIAVNNVSVKKWRLLVMASRVLRKESVIDNIYTPVLINKAKSKLCNICSEYIKEKEAKEKNFVYSRTKRGNEVFVHMHCWKQEVVK